MGRHATLVNLGGYSDNNVQLIYLNAQQQLDKMPAMDSAIAQALSLESPLPEMEVHGGSNFASTYKITCEVDGETKAYFVKTSSPDTKSMFAGKSI
jgi:hypothetical protein